jgi:hypothetical protein
VQKEDSAAERPFCDQLSVDRMLHGFPRDLDGKTSVRSLNVSNAYIHLAGIVCETASKKHGQP